MFHYKKCLKRIILTKNVWQKNFRFKEKTLLRFLMFKVEFHCIILFFVIWCGIFLFFAVIISDVPGWFPGEMIQSFSNGMNWSHQTISTTFMRIESIVFGKYFRNSKGVPNREAMNFLYDFMFRTFCLSFDNSVWKKIDLQNFPIFLIGPSNFSPPTGRPVINLWNNRFF